VVDISEVETYRRQMLELTESNKQPTAVIQKLNQPAKKVSRGDYDSDEEGVHIE